MFTSYSANYFARNRPEKFRGFRETHASPIPLKHGTLASVSARVVLGEISISPSPATESKLFFEWHRTPTGLPISVYGVELLQVAVSVVELASV